MATVPLWPGRTNWSGQRLPASICSCTDQYRKHCDPSYILHLAKSSGQFPTLHLTDLSATSSGCPLPPLSGTFWARNSSGFPPTSAASLGLLHALLCLLSYCQVSPAHPASPELCLYHHLTRHPLAYHAAAASKAHLLCVFPLLPHFLEFLSCSNWSSQGNPFQT